MWLILKIALGTVVGGIIGFFVYKLVGCRSGTCPMASNPWVSTLWWAMIGGVIMYGTKFPPTH